MNNLISLIVVFYALIYCSENLKINYYKFKLTGNEKTKEKPIDTEKFNLAYKDCGIYNNYFNIRYFIFI